MVSPTLRVVVAEDEALTRKRLVRLLQEAGCEVVREFQEGQALKDYLRTGIESLDAVFVDIHMPNVDGMALLQAFGAEIPHVLVTAHHDHAVAAFDTEAVDYLLKPVTATRLNRALNRIQALRAEIPARPEPELPDLHRFPVTAGEGVVFIDLHKTTHFEVENEVVWAHAGGRFRTTWTSLGSVEAAFPRSGMIRVHRHLLLRPEAVVGLLPAPGGRLRVRLTGGTEIEASRGGAPRLRERLGL